ncbi:unnamed protein product [Vicia faba]|uniref:Uncharacterized protein n=1 Tax=Vicia faba TaxID=3906 RepID=A0AAV1ATN5_VICFA|nr:unnamed protein product [Vicia faba]
MLVSIQLPSSMKCSTMVANTQHHAVILAFALNQFLLSVNVMMLEKHATQVAKIALVILLNHESVVAMISLISVTENVTDYVKDTYSCDTCFVCVEIEVSLQVDIVPADEVIDEEVAYAAEVLDVSAAPTTSFSGQPLSLEPQSLLGYLNYSSMIKFEQEEKLVQEHKKGIGWTLAYIIDITSSISIKRVP